MLGKVLSRFFGYWKWLLGTIVPLVLWEIFKDGILGWANNQISEAADANRSVLVAALGWLASTQIGWSVLIFVSALAVILIHSYSFELQKKIDTATKNQPENQEIGQPQNQAGELFPDMTIGELFSYICINTNFLGENSEVLEDENWLKIGADIRDKASTGQLKLWGRAYGEQFGDMLGKNPLTEVSKKYWKEGDFTYQFFGGWGDDPPHTHPGPGDDELRDLRVCKSQIINIWPPSISSKQDAVDHLSVLLSEGINKIWNGPVSNDSELTELDNIWHGWQSRVEGCLSHHFNSADVDHFARLGVVPLITKEPSYNDQHRKILREYALKESRLREIIRDHNVRHV